MFVRDVRNWLPSDVILYPRRSNCSITPPWMQPRLARPSPLLTTPQAPQNQRRWYHYPVKSCCFLTVQNRSVHQTFTSFVGRPYSVTNNWAPRIQFTFSFCFVLCSDFNISHVYAYFFHVAPFFCVLLSNCSVLFVSGVHRRLKQYLFFILSKNTKTLWVWDYASFQIYRKR